MKGWINWIQFIAQEKRIITTFSFIYGFNPSISEPILNDLLPSECVSFEYTCLGFSILCKEEQLMLSCSNCFLLSIMMILLKKIYLED